MNQGRYVDAIHLYQSVLRGLASSASPICPPSTSGQIDVGTWLARAYLQHGHSSDALKTMHCLLLLNPTVFHNWFNLAIVREEHAVRILKKQEKVSSQELEQAAEVIQSAQILFSSLKRLSASYEPMRQMSLNLILPKTVAGENIEKSAPETVTSHVRSIMSVNDMHNVRTTVLFVDPRFIDSHSDSCLVIYVLEPTFHYLFFPLFF